MDKLGRVLAAVSDPTRRAIIDRLARGPARVTDVAAPFAISLNAVSKHIKVLETAGVVRRARQGREHTLQLNADPLQQVARWVHRYSRFWSDRLRPRPMSTTHGSTPRARVDRGSGAAG